MKNLVKLSVATMLLLAVSSCKKPDACMAVPQTVEVGKSFQMNTCSINANEYEWNMGDGSKLTGESPTYTYWNTGDYYVEHSALKGNKRSSTYQTIKVVHENYKFAGNFNLNSNCQGDQTSYNVLIETIGTNEIRLSNFMNMGWVILGSVSGDNVSFYASSWLQDPSGDYYDFNGGSGTINGNTITMNWSIDDYNHNNVLGLYSCGATLNRY